jgi:hypothetical protein
MHKIIVITISLHAYHNKPIVQLKLLKLVVEKIQQNSAPILSATSIEYIIAVITPLHSSNLFFDVFIFFKSYIIIFIESVHEFRHLLMSILRIPKILNKMVQSKICDKENNN